MVAFGQRDRDLSRRAIVGARVGLSLVVLHFHAKSSGCLPGGSYGMDFRRAIGPVPCTEWLNSPIATKTPFPTPRRREQNRGYLPPSLPYHLRQLQQRNGFSAFDFTGQARM